MQKQADIFPFIRNCGRFLMVLLGLLVFHFLNANPLVSHKQTLTSVGFEEEIFLENSNHHDLPDGTKHDPIGSAEYDADDFEKDDKLSGYYFNSTIFSEYSDEQGVHHFSATFSAQNPAVPFYVLFHSWKIFSL